MKDVIEIRPSLLMSPKVQRMARWLMGKDDFLPFLYGASIPVHLTVRQEVVSRIVITGLMMTWASVRELAPDGIMEGAVLEDVDAMAGGIPLFGAAMLQVEWLESSVVGLVFPNFEEWNPRMKSATSKAKEKTEEMSYPEDFEEFWRAYPKKTGKGAALKAWKRINPGQKLKSQMIEAIKVQCRSQQWLKDKGQYIPHPATWLNQFRWEDTPERLQPTSQDVINDIARKMAERRKEAERSEVGRWKGDIRELIKKKREGLS